MSTQSSPRSFSDDTPFPHYAVPQHAHTYPLPAYPRPAHRNTLPPLPISLSVSTSTAASDHDPNERTARPSNAHKHAQFLSGELTGDDPGATPVVPLSLIHI